MNGQAIIKEGPFRRGNRANYISEERIDGCDWHDKCLSCPFSKCLFESTTNYIRTEVNALAFGRFLKEQGAIGLEEAAERYGIATRTAYRYAHVIMDRKLVI